MTIAVVVVAGVAYALGVRRAARRGTAWPRARTLMFFALGLGSYALVELGFLGSWSAQLRWAFTARIALLLLVVPALLALGAPLELARAGMGDAGRARLDRIMAGRVSRVLGNAMFLTLFTAAVFCVFLTPVVGVLRTSPVIGEAIGAVTVLAGLTLIVPMTALTAAHATTFLAIEFVLAFVELVIDAIPGILMRLNESVIDGITTVSGAGWWPGALHDQHLAGDLLWFIAEAADVPVLILLLVRWGRRDRAEAQDFDALTDEEHDALVRAHLRGERAGSDAAG